VSVAAATRRHFDQWCLERWYSERGYKLVPDGPGDMEKRIARVSPERAERLATCCINTVNLKNPLRDVQSNRANVHLGRLPFWRLSKNLHGTLRCRWRSRPQHQKRTAGRRLGMSGLCPLPDFSADESSPVRARVADPKRSRSTSTGSLRDGVKKRGGLKTPSVGLPEYSSVVIGCIEYVPADGLALATRPRW
jgi:hypothetical protein